MTIVDFLKSELGTRVVSNGDKWLVWNNVLSEWVVYERKHYRRQSLVLIQTIDEERAVRALVEGK